MKVVFVCYGNICRSPTAEGVFAALVQRDGLESQIEVTSAGTSDCHAGEPPDNRARQHARERGYDLSRVRAKQITTELLSNADYVLVMDRGNLEAVLQVCPPEHRAKVQLFLEYAPNQPTREVPDPYWGGGAGFERVLDLAETASRGLLAAIRARIEAPK